MTPLNQSERYRPPADLVETSWMVLVVTFLLMVVLVVMRAPALGVSVFALGLGVVAGRISGDYSRWSRR